MHDSEFARGLPEYNATDDSGQYLLRLYVTGSTPSSIKAVANMKMICEKYLSGRYKLEVIDIYQQPKLARGDQIIATPTLVKHLPDPLKRLIGDMSHTDKVLIGLDLRPQLTPSKAKRHDAS